MAGSGGGAGGRGGNGGGTAGAGTAGRGGQSGGGASGSSGGAQGACTSTHASTATRPQLTSAEAANYTIARYFASGPRHLGSDGGPRRSELVHRQLHGGGRRQRHAHDRAGGADRGRVGIGAALHPGQAGHLPRGGFDLGLDTDHPVRRGHRRDPRRHRQQQLRGRRGGNRRRARRSRPRRRGSSS